MHSSSIIKSTMDEYYNELICSSALFISYKLALISQSTVLGWQLQPGNLKMQIPGLHPDLLNQKLWLRVPTICVFISPPGDLNAHRILNEL